MVVIVSLLVQVGLFPLLTYHFGEFSLIGPLANAIVVPWLGILVPLALLLLVVTAFFPVFGPLLNTPNEWFLNSLDQFINWSSQLEWSWMQVHQDSMLIFPIWITAIFVIATLFIPRLRWKMVICFLALLTLRAGTELIQNLSPSKLIVTIFDVGQGDAALVSTPNDAHFLIDAGRWSPGYNSARYIILPHLRQEGIEKLDAVFLSHPHADHIGGIMELINEIPIDTIYNSGYTYDSKLYQRYQEAAAEKSIPIKSLQAGTTINLDPSILLMAYGPLPSTSGSDPNEHSLILELIYRDTEFLFTGDAGKQQEYRLLQKFGPLLDTDFLKVGHHGSRTSSSPAFLQMATPELSIASLGKSNRYEHPHSEAVRRLRTFSENTLFTSLQKALIFSSDGTKISRLQW
ncbi:MAG: ComEC/Rec2 family competence protein [Balneolaceae bacterium]|nr:ComEC/Rec2 family competence protein [Balneolaceae bacterium]